MSYDLNITISGPQGSGKTRIADAVTDQLTQMGFSFSRKAEGKFYSSPVERGINGHAVVEEVRANPDLIAWGEPISVHRQRPTWLRDGEEYKVWSASTFANDQWNAIDSIKLPAGHAYYTATGRGFAYWSGKVDELPVDWDGGEVLLRNGSTHPEPTWWGRGRQPYTRGHRPENEVIGYRKIDREMNRAAVEAGFAPLSDYVKSFHSVECGGSAPPVYVMTVPTIPADLGEAMKFAARGEVYRVTGIPNLFPGATLEVRSPGSNTTPFTIGSDNWPGLSKVIEEAGELIQVLSKLMQRGGATDHWSGDLRQMAVQEIGDLYAALDFFVDKNPSLNKADIETRRFEKQVTFQRWHRENGA